MALRNQRLFHHFDQRIQGRTTAIENWIHMVQIAQTVHQEDLQNTSDQPTLEQFSFTIKDTTNNTSHISSGTRDYLHSTNIPLPTNSRASWAQQDLRHLMLIPNPNIRKKSN